VDGLLPADDRLGVLDALWRAFPPDEPLGDAIGLAVARAILDAERVTCPNPHSCPVCNTDRRADRFADDDPSADTRY
jgi:hypothetical protein